MLQRRSIETRSNSSNPLLAPKPTAPSLAPPEAIIENQLKNIQTSNQPFPTVSNANLPTIRASDKIQSKTKDLTETQPLEAHAVPSVAPAPNTTPVKPAPPMPPAPPVPPVPAPVAVPPAPPAPPSPPETDASFTTPPGLPTPPSPPAPP
jgi:hypothetical protein